MKSLIGSLIGLVLSVHVGAEPLLEGRVRLSSGQPAADVQVRLVTNAPSLPTHKTGIWIWCGYLLRPVWMSTSSPIAPLLS